MRNGGTLAAFAFGAACFFLHVSSADAQGPVRSDVQAIFGRYNVTNGFSDRTFETAWGNAYFANGLGVHAEIHNMNREEDATFFAAGLSYNKQSFSLRGTVGTSTDNVNILPEAYARLEASFRTPPETGWVFTPSVTYRDYPNGANETELQGQVLKYVPIGRTASLILMGLVRGTWIDPGDHFVTSIGGGITYAEYRKFSVGVVVEGGRAAYDATFGIGSIDEPYIAVRPSVGIYLTNSIELVAQGEFSDRDSYRVMGGHLGLKFYFE